MIFSLNFLSLCGQEISITRDSKSKMEKSSDGKGIIFHGTLIYHNWKGKVISHKKYYRLENSGKFGMIVSEGIGDTLNFKLKSYKSSLYKHKQLPLLNLQGIKGDTITPGKNNRSVIFAFWAVSCSWLPYEFLNTLDSLAYKHPEVDIIAIPLFPNAESMVKNMTYKNLKLISGYHYEYEKYFVSGERIVVMTDKNMKIKKYYRGKAYQRLRKINSFLRSK